MLILRHAKEAWRTSNTARLASLALSRVEVVEIGAVPAGLPGDEVVQRSARALRAFEEERRETLGAIARFVERAEPVWLLFPTGRADAAAAPSTGRMATGSEARGPHRLIVPDGSWRQARRMVQRIPQLDRLPRLSLPAPPPAGRRLRRPPLREGMSTLEAIARALQLLEGEEVGRPLLDLYGTHVERQLLNRRRNVR